MNNPIWSPSPQQIKSTTLFTFMELLKRERNVNCVDYHSLWNWSVENEEVFWDYFWDFSSVIGDKGDCVLDNNEGKIFGSKFFPNGSINYAENCLLLSNETPAIIFRDEIGTERTLSYAELCDQVSLWQQALRNAGVQKGDRIAAYMPNIPETIVAALATASLGAIWSSASPDFGAQGLIDRFGQIAPKILITVDGYYYNGKTLDCLEKIKDLQKVLPSLTNTIVVPFAGSSIRIDELSNASYTSEFLLGYFSQPLQFLRVPFNHPLFIMFSSGTTGVPKCIVHGHGGTLLQHLKEHKLQCDIRQGDNVFYFTTCGWMMWNWLVTVLASKATLLLYDGSPFYKDGYVLWEYTSKHKCTFFGTSAKYIDALKQEGLNPSKLFDLSNLRTLSSTGSPLVHESFDYVYSYISSNIHLASISGGTDIISCFMLGNPISSVWRGELQGAGLGMAVSILDDEGKPIKGRAGELACLKPFPSMPVCFWNDPDDSKYRAAYFERFDNIWVHGDWVEETSHGGFIIHGRSDATLNPGGVRIGTAEIYRQVEQVEAVKESIAIGQDWEGDVRVILFVILKPGWALDENLIKEIKGQIRKGASPRHVPAKIIQVADIPRTKSGKITELAVRDVVHDRNIKNVEALANPQSLELFRNLDELKS